MDFLWKKNASGVYTNYNKNSIEILPGISLTDFSMIWGVEQNKKKNVSSTKLRLLGNQKKDEKDWHNAMTFYNRSFVMLKSIQKMLVWHMRTDRYVF